MIFRKNKKNSNKVIAKEKISPIKEGQVFIIENILSFKGKMMQQQLQEEIVEIGKVLQEIGVKANGNITTVNYGVEGEVMEMEVLVPLILEAEIYLPHKYTFKPLIKIDNALSIRHCGNPVRLVDTMKTLQQYIVENNKKVSGPTYTVTVKVPKTQAEIEETVVDIYVPCVSA